jgi:Aerotolerance regulator N-terminal
MIWLYPPAAIALLALAAPIAVHVLARQRATRVAFPTLRFIHPHRLASVRRRALDDVALLTIRLAIFTVAVAAIAGPFFTTAARRRAWDARTIRAEVSDPAARYGLTRAVAWLERQPPGRREIVVRGPLLIGSLTATDIATVPSHVGLHFERTPAPAATRTLPATPVIQKGQLVERETTLNAERTSVRDVAANGSALPAIEIAAPAEERAAADRLRRALLDERIAAALPGRGARITFASEAATPSTVSTAWIADAAARIARDTPEEVHLSFGSDGNRLDVATRMRATDARALPLVHVVARGLASPIERPADEIVPIPDAQLSAWTRAAGPVPEPAPEMIDRDDRRWLWATVLTLLLIESVLRRDRKRSGGAKESARAA